MPHQQDTELAELAGGFIHDLKNSFSTLSLQLQLLSEDFADPQNPKERRAVDRVNRLQGECQRLVDISNDFLRYARVKDLERTPTDLLVLVDEMVDFFAPVAKTANIEVKSYVPTGLPSVLLDVPLFKQAMLNLLLNAQQAMPEGGTITLQASADAHEVTLQVIDTGKGMPPEVAERAFRPFYSTRPGGAGLGLPTTRKVVLAHGGDLSVESEQGKGTRFTLRLPVAGVGGPEVYCLLNGTRLPLGEAKVSVLDRGFLFGDGIYEVLRIYSGKPWLEADHFARLERSLAAVRIAGVDLARLRQQIREGILSGGFREAIVYIQITRGVAPRLHAFPANVRPTELMWIKEAVDTYGPWREHGVKVSLQPDLRWKRCDIKSINLLANVLANQTAKEADAVEAILCHDDGTITEASHSSLFGVVGGKIRTTADSPGILPGITRKFTLELAARIGVPVDFRSLHRDDLAGTEELFLTGTSMEVCPVVRVDEQVIAGGKPGPVTRRLQAAYREVLAEFRRDAEREPATV
jgi:D-alanine transaminase